MTATTYRHKQNEADAIQYDGTQESRDALFEWSAGAVRPISVDGFPIVVGTLDSQPEVNIGDYVLTEDDGATFYILTADEFAVAFEEIPEEP